MLNVNPEILVWARENAGLSLSEAAPKLEIRPARGIQPAERLAALEQGKVRPTRTLLLRMSRVYRRSLVVFYLSQPPRQVERGEDFRTLPDQANQSVEATLDALLRDVRARQAIVRDALESDPDHIELAFVASATSDRGVAAIATSIRETIGFDLSGYRSRPTPDDAFTYLRAMAEDAGVFVLLIGDLGSHHSAIDVDAFRGFALADRVAPFIVINDRDARSAWSFTLLHELAHIWLGQTAISGGAATAGVERFCNDIATTILLPVSDLRTFTAPTNLSTDRLIDAIGAFARSRHVSSSMIAYRLFIAQRLSRDQWATISDRLASMWLSERDKRRQRARSAEGGPNYYVVKRHRVGRALINAVTRLLREGTLSTSQAAKALGVKPKQVGTLLGLQSSASAGNEG